MNTTGLTAGSRGEPRAWILASLGLLVGMAYINCLSNDFVGDDSSLVLKNQAITTIKGLPTLLTSDYWVNFRGPHEAAPVQSSGLYRPLVSVSYALNFALGGLAPWGYHLLNVALHLLVTWLVFLVASHVGLAREPAFVAAAVFAVHPLHTEAVAQVVGRAELLMSLGVLGAVWFELAGRRRLALLAFAAALFSKEQAMILPGLLLARDLVAASDSAGERRWPGGRAWLRTAVSRYGPYLAVLGGYLAIRAKVLGGFPLPPLRAVENPLAFLDWEPRLLTALKIAGWYLRLFLWPDELLADYSGGTIAVARSVFDPGVLWGFGAWAALLGLAVRAFGRPESRLWFSVMFTGLAYLPASNLVVPIGTIMAERLFYLPSAGLCLLVGLLYERGMQSAARRAQSTSPDPLQCSAFSVQRSLLIVICLALMARTVVRNQDWRDAETLFRKTVAAAPNNGKAYVFLGGAFRKMGRFAQALEAYDTAARANPDYLRDDPHFLWQRGILLVKLGRTSEAVESLEQAATLDPAWGAIRTDLGLAYAAAGDYARAEAMLRQAIAIAPASPYGYGGLSLILNEQARFAEALQAADAALSRDPTYVRARYNRAEALEGLGRLEEAVRAYEHVLALGPTASDRRVYEEAEERLERLRGLSHGRSPSLCPPGLVGC
jgi:tetratricopeptide (TPR) repeat protein